MVVRAPEIKGVRAELARALGACLGARSRLCQRAQGIRRVENELRGHAGRASCKQTLRNGEARTLASCWRRQVPATWSSDLAPRRPARVRRTCVDYADRDETSHLTARYLHRQLHRTRYFCLAKLPIRQTTNRLARVSAKPAQKPPIAHPIKSRCQCGKHLAQMPR